MPFQEKSAWVMAVTLLLGGICYFATVAALSADDAVTPWAVVHYTITLWVIASVGQIVIAVISPKDAKASLDERERRIFDRAGYWSGHITGRALILGELAEYALQIVFYRRAV